jgi:hypothetical protein
MSNNENIANEHSPNKEFSYEMKEDQDYSI